MACADRPAGTAPVAVAPGKAIVVPDDTNWNSFTTEVGVLVTGDYPNWGVVDPTASRSFGFTLTRTALNGGNWANVISFDGQAPSNLKVDPGDYDTGLGRIEQDDARTYMRLYDTQGRQVTVQPADTTVPPIDPSIVAPPRDTGSYPRHPSNPGIPMPVPRLGAGGLTTARAVAASPDSRAWIDFFIIGARGRDRIRQNLVTQATQTAVTASGAEEFTTALGRDAFTITLDRVSGAPATLTRMASGQLVSRETREYAPFGPQAFALKRSRIELFELGRAIPVRQVTLDYVNTALARVDR